MQRTVRVQRLEFRRGTGDAKPAQRANHAKTKGVGERQQRHEVVERALAAALHQQLQRLDGHLRIDVGERPEQQRLYPAIAQPGERAKGGAPHRRRRVVREFQHPVQVQLSTGRLEYAQGVAEEFRFAGRREAFRQ